MRTRKRFVLTWYVFVMLATLGFVHSSHAQESPSPSDNMKPFSVTDQTGFKEGRFRGELVQFDDTNVVIKTKEGKEVRLHRDKTTRTVGQIKEGAMIEAEANDQNHVLSIQLFSQSDANKTNVGKKK